MVELDPDDPRPVGAVLQGHAPAGEGRPGDRRTTPTWWCSTSPSPGSTPASAATSSACSTDSAPRAAACGLQPRARRGRALRQPGPGHGPGPTGGRGRLPRHPRADGRPPPPHPDPIRPARALGTGLLGPGRVWPCASSGDGAARRRHRRRRPPPPARSPWSPRSAARASTRWPRSTTTSRASSATWWGTDVASTRTRAPRPTACRCTGSCCAPRSPGPAARRRLGVLSVIVGVVVGRRPRRRHPTSTTSSGHPLRERRSGCRCWCRSAPWCSPRPRLGDPDEDGTLVYLWLRPVRRSTARARRRRRLVHRDLAARRGAPGRRRRGGGAATRPRGRGGRGGHRRAGRLHRGVLRPRPARPSGPWSGGCSTSSSGRGSSPPPTRPRPAWPSAPTPARVLAASAGVALRDAAVASPWRWLVPLRRGPRSALRLDA